MPKLFSDEFKEWYNALGPEEQTEVREDFFSILNNEAMKEYLKERGVVLPEA